MWTRQSRRTQETTTQGSQTEFRKGMKINTVPWVVDMNVTIKFKYFLREESGEKNNQEVAYSQSNLDDNLNYFLYLTLNIC